MAIYYLRMKTFGRSQGKRGSRVASAAAYRSGERIRDEHTGRLYDHRQRTDVLYKEIVLPARLATQSAALAWARDRATLWNAAEHAESRRNSRLAREFVVALPHELAPAARTQLAMQFARNIADRYGSAVDVAVHAPRGDARNFHAHLLATTREIMPEGLGRKTTLELSGTRRHELGLPRWREEIGSLREKWADLTNTALEGAHVAARVTHLTRAERGLAASGAAPRVPLAAYHMELRGERSFIAEKIRERHRADLARANAGPAREAFARSASARPPNERERTLAAIGRSMVWELGAGVRSAWRGLQERLGLDRAATRKGAPALESNPASAPIGQGSVAAIERSGERARALAEPTDLGAEAIGRSAQIDPATRSALNWAAYRAKHRVADIDAAQSARNWLAYREKQRARDAAGLGTAEESATGARREHSRKHDNDFSL
ncbi:MAG: MobA/MobL family protein [Steroidobacteraceae bacterium]